MLNSQLYKYGPKIVAFTYHFIKCLNLGDLKYMLNIFYIFKVVMLIKGWNYVISSKNKCLDEIWGKNYQFTNMLLSFSFLLL